jgi:hypothetical protein
MRHFSILAAATALSFSVHAATPTEVVAAYHSALAKGNTEQAAALLSPTIQIYESAFVDTAFAKSKVRAI